MKSYTMATWKVSKDNKAEALYDYHLRPRWQDVEINDKLFGEDGAFYAIKYNAFKNAFTNSYEREIDELISDYSNDVITFDVINDLDAILEMRN